MDKIYTIDRFEEEYAICEDINTKKMIKIKKEDLPKNIKEGDFIKFILDKYIIDEEKTVETEKRIKEKMDRLFKN